MKKIIYSLVVLFIVTAIGSAQAQKKKAPEDLAIVKPLNQLPNGTWNSIINVEPVKDGSNYVQAGNYNKWVEEGITDTDGDGSPDFISNGYNRIMDFYYKPGNKKYNSKLGKKIIKKAIVDGAEVPLTSFQPIYPTGWGDKFYRGDTVTINGKKHLRLSGNLSELTEVSDFGFFMLSCETGGSQEWEEITMQNVNSWGWGEIIIPFDDIYYRDDVGNVTWGLLKFCYGGKKADGTIIWPKNIQDCTLLDQTGIASVQIWYP